MNAINEIGQSEMFVKTLIKGWTTQITRVNELLGSLSDEDLIKETSPGRNTGVYLLGHLVAVHDAMSPLLGFGEKQYPQLEPLFITTPDKSGQTFPPIYELKKYWEAVNAHLLQNFNSLSPTDWLSKHSSISAEDFVKEPHRNKLSILISRTTHLSSHWGQLIYLRKKNQL